MRALTIVQPYAHLISLPDNAPAAKRVENRTWPTTYHGELAIHAGKSRERLDEAAEYGLDPRSFTFGAIVAVARLAGCFRLGDRQWPDDGHCIPAEWLRRYPWLAAHEHCEGPWCWVLAEVWSLSMPLHCAGAQGLWTPSPEIIEAARDRSDAAGWRRKEG